MSEAKALQEVQTALFFGRDSQSPLKGQQFLETKYLLTKNLRESPQSPQPSLKSSSPSRQGRIHKGKWSLCTRTAKIPSSEAPLPVATMELPWGPPCSSCFPTQADSSWRTTSCSSCMLLRTEGHENISFCHTPTQTLTSPTANRYKSEHPTTATTKLVRLCMVWCSQFPDGCLAKQLFAKKHIQGKQERSKKKKKPTKHGGPKAQKIQVFSTVSTVK